MDLLAWGVPIDPTRSGPFDLTPLIAIVAALLVFRFVLQRPFTPLMVATAALTGSGWALGEEIWGPALPTLAAAAITIVVMPMARRSRGPSHH
jgi:hypothetical protein